MLETSKKKFKRHSVTKKCSDLSLFEQIVLVISKFLEIFSRSLEHFFLTVGQNNFGNKIPFTDVVNWFLQLKNVIWISKLGPNLQNLQKFAFALKVSRFLNILSNIDLFGEWISALNINFAEFLNIFWYRVESKLN